MRLSSITAALCLGAAAMAAPLGGAWAADAFVTHLYQKTDLGPQAIAPDSPLEAGSAVRLIIEASEDVTISVTWRPMGGEAQALASDVKLAKGGTLAVPGKKEWVELGAGQGRESFTVFATDGAGNVEEEQVAYVILTDEIALADQEAFAAFSSAKAKGGAQPLSGFSSQTFSSKTFTGNKGSGMAAQLAKVPPEPPTFSGSGAALFKKVADGVVLVLTNEGLGSGAVINADGTIITNWHVVKGYKTVGVVFRPPSGTPLSEDMVVFADVVKISESQDLAMLKLQGPMNGGSVLTLGTMDNVDIGNEVHAVGHPQGESWTYTRGYVSQIRNDYQWDIGLGVTHHGQIIQTQTPINPGNSGGPLFDDDGKVIGINSFVNLESQGLNYALSVDEVGKFLSTQVANTPSQPTQPGLPSQPSQPAVPQPAQPAQPAVPQPAQPQPPQPQLGGQPSPSQPMVPQPKTVEPAPQPEEEQAESDLEFFPLDTDGNGKDDAFGADRNGDGYYDIVMVDEDEDGQIDYVLFDDNFNNVPDAKLVFMEDEEGPFDVWIFDDNEDGEPDYYGMDWNLDGEIDEWREG